MTMTSTGVDNTYNGWANYHTWNVSLYINNEYAIYKMARDYARQCERLDEKVDYETFAGVLSMCYDNITPDGVSWTDPSIDTDEMNEMLEELVN